jgi:hypothetical protein
MMPFVVLVMNFCEYSSRAREPRNSAYSAVRLNADREWG